MLEQVIAEFDGRHVAGLRAATRALGVGDMAHLARYCHSRDGREAVAATWMVKALLEQGRGGDLPLAQTFEALTDIADPEAALHLLQSVQHQPGACDAALIEPYLDHSKTLVRVWALDAYVRVAMRSGKNLERAHGLTARAVDDKKASMRARARALLALF